MNDEYRATIRSAGHAREHFVNAMSLAKTLLDNGEQVLLTVSVALEPVGIQQRKFLHGPVYTQISEQVRVSGERFTVDVWKEYFRRLILEREPEYVMQKMPGAKRATPRRVRRSTESLGVRAYAKFIDEVIDYAVLEWGCVFRFEMNEREAVRYVDPRRLKKPASVGELSTTT